MTGEHEKDVLVKYLTKPQPRESAACDLRRLGVVAVTPRGRGYQRIAGPALGLLVTPRMPRQRVPVMQNQVEA